MSKMIKGSYIFGDSKFVKIPLSCVAGFIHGLTIECVDGDYTCVLGVTVYGDMATVEYASAIFVEE